MAGKEYNVMYDKKKGKANNRRELEQHICAKQTHHYCVSVLRSFHLLCCTETILVPLTKPDW